MIKNTMYNSAQSRNRTIDITRGIAVFSIIIGHLRIALINRVVFTFHVPIFFILTGYFIRQEPIGSFVKKKVKSILVPYAVTCIVIILLAGAIALIQDGNSDVFDVMRIWISASLYGAGDSYTEPFVIYSIGAIWFLWASFWGSLFLQFSLDWKTVSRVIFLAMLFAAGYITARRMFWFPLSIQAGCCSVLYMYIGLCIRKSQSASRVTGVWLKRGITLVSFAGWAYCIYSFQSFWLVHNDFGCGLIDIACSLCGCYCVFLISQMIDRHSRWLASVLSYFGANSLIVLCVHTAEMALINWWYVVSIFEKTGIPHLISCGLAAGLKIILIITLTWIIVAWKGRVRYSTQM